MLEAKVVNFKCSWCGEIVAGAPVMEKPIVVCGGRAHWLRRKGVLARFERSDVAEKEQRVAEAA